MPRVSLAEVQALAERYLAEHPARARFDGKHLSYARMKPGEAIFLLALWSGFLVLAAAIGLGTRASGDSYLPGLGMFGFGLVAGLFVIAIAGQNYLDLETGSIYRHHVWGDKLLLNVDAIDQVNRSHEGSVVTVTASGTRDGHRVTKRLGVFRSTAEAEDFVQLITMMGTGVAAPL